ncbi:CRISPR-associated endonuclease Cas2 [Candidatus Collierbacteria bacterium]|nr:CRISPR-associated endonuclease Cas2 [Candidatus Collierbacteria bacterium]
MNREKSIRDTHRLVKEISLGVCGNLVDITLFLVCFAGGYILSSMNTSKGRVNLEPLKILLKEYPQLRLKLRNVLRLAKRDGLIDGDDGLTSAGFNKLNEILPKIKRWPKWSGSLWLITYDVSEKRKKDREIFRRFLLDQGYGKLQDSVYVSPFDPTRLVRSEIEKRQFRGEVIVSKMGVDGHIGEMSVKELISKVYDLESISVDYLSYVQSVSGDFPLEKAPFLFLEYLSILKSDPQLPEELLPVDWPGKKAFELTNKKLLPYLQHDKRIEDLVLRNINIYSLKTM